MLVIDIKGARKLERVDIRLESIDEKGIEKLEPNFIVTFLSEEILIIVILKR